MIELKRNADGHGFYLSRDMEVVADRIQKESDGKMLAAAEQLYDAAVEMVAHLRDDCYALEQCAALDIYLKKLEDALCAADGLVCPECGGCAESLTEIDDRDDSVGYHSTRVMCAACVEKRRNAHVGD